MPHCRKSAEAYHAICLKGGETLPKDVSQGEPVNGTRVSEHQFVELKGNWLCTEKWKIWEEYRSCLSKGSPDV